MTTATKPKTELSVLVVKPLVQRVLTVRITGLTPLVQNKFSNKAKTTMLTNMSTPASEKKSRSARPPRDYDADFKGAQHIMRLPDGTLSNGIPCAAFRNALIDACRTVGIVMTKAKMGVFCLHDGVDIDDGTPLVRLIADAPRRSDLPVRNDSGATDIRIRPMWLEWAADVRLSFDADMISASSVANLLARAGRQVGIGEGRPFSKNSAGQGWGTFSVETQMVNDEQE